MEIHADKDRYGKLCSNSSSQLASLSGITGVVNANEDAYQDYIDANPGRFGSPATLAEVQTMITAVISSTKSIQLKLEMK